jgi:asparagine synthetase B (glutamine-hydrolysing)
VAVSGLGGDELFGGYPAFRDLPRWRRWLGPVARVPGLGVGLRRLAGWEEAALRRDLESLQRVLARSPIRYLKNLEQTQAGKTSWMIRR